MNNQKNKQLGKKLKQKRKEKGVKQLVLARKLKVSLSYISKLENGQIPIYLLLFMQYCKEIDIYPLDFMNTINDLLV